MGSTDREGNAISRFNANAVWGHDKCIDRGCEDGEDICRGDDTDRGIKGDSECDDSSGREGDTAKGTL